jgi:hypothetical protein
MLTLGAMGTIACIIAVPVSIVLTIIGWRNAYRKAKEAIARDGGAAISGNIGEGDIVTGHSSQVKLAVTTDTTQSDRYERRYAVFRAIDGALTEALTNAIITSETLNCFSEAITDARFLFEDREFLEYLEEVRANVAKFQSIMITMEAMPPGIHKAWASAAAGKIRPRLINQIDDLPERFRPFLQD